MSNGKGSRPRPVNGAKYRRHYDAIFRKRKDRGPFGCKCQTLAQKVCGDGCDICNPELEREIERENAARP